MSFLNDHIKRRKSHTNVSNLKRLKNVEVTGNKAYTHVSSATVSSAMQIDRQVINPSINNEIIANTESPKSCIASQLSNAESNVEDEVLIQPCANFLTSFKKIFLQRTGPSSSLITSLENDFSISSDSSRHCTDTFHSLDEYDQSNRNSIFLLRESSTSSPALTIPEATSLL